ncbi:MULTISPECIES: GNAT family N-acetyltransferase [Calothrix]|uniref:GNAT family N-acetyltransferase n=2 Tax=Calothrix TaxID=1186 RepID=A0ABR8A9V4_9CYAN|nr:MULTISPECIES: GNAT family N-acetyltransferase [Calothrix]MBD2196711.1 GNAT family N-acetyltransferase [Calothrix parietina FACHB-288]MBD2224190.1 GNAT family N-acetyltransferase [Calothrix anomala FACHB-343]
MNCDRFQQSFAVDPSLSGKLFDLLEITFPGLSSLAECGRKLGASWEAASTPFIYFHEGIAISHVGVVEIPFYIMGKRVTVGGIHAVATRPEFRRKGYYRAVMNEVLEYCDKLYETLVLSTSQPEFYLPFGFRVVAEHIFKVQCNSTGSTDGWRQLDLTTDKDLRLLHRLLETRVPVSNVVGVVQEKAVFFVNEGSRPLYYAADLDAIACMEIEDTRLHLFDIVSTNIHPLSEILVRIPQFIEEVVIYFSPELLNTENVQAFPGVIEETVLMVRGKFAAEKEKFMLPRSARC